MPQRHAAPPTEAGKGRFLFGGRLPSLGKEFGKHLNGVDVRLEPLRRGEFVDIGRVLAVVEVTGVLLCGLGYLLLRLFRISSIGSPSRRFISASQA